MNLHFLVLLAATLAFSGTAFAAKPAPPKKVVVTDVRTTGTLDVKTVQSLSALIATEAGKLPVKVTSGGDIAALLGLERQKALLGCTDNSCLAEIGGALGAGYLLATEIGVVDGIYLLTMITLETGKAKALHRVSKQAKRLKELIPACRAATIEAISAIPGVSEAMEEAAEFEEPAEVAQPATSPRATMHAAGIALDVVGGAAIAGGAACGVLALLQFESAKKTAAGPALDSARATGKTEAVAADVLYTVGAAALVTGLVLTFLGSSSPGETSASVTLSPVRGGGAVAVSGRF
ncbi:MAG: hypothetical protein QM765_13035 [Myxococcales bacterium]